MADLVFPLLIAHLLADFAFQTDAMIAAKRRYGVIGVAPHIAVVALCSLLAVLPRLGAWWPYILLLVLIHYALDAAKVRVDGSIRSRAISLGLFFLDQLLHLLTIWAIALLARMAGLGALWPLSGALWGTLLVAVTITFAYGILVRVVAPAAGWPNRWPGVIARGLTFLLVWTGFAWLAWLPAPLALAYHRWRGLPLHRTLWIDVLLGSLLAFLGALLLPAN